MIQISVDGSDPHPVNLEDVFADSYRSFLLDVLQSTIYPGWPDLVQSYQHYEIELSDMSSRLVTETGYVLNLIAHADATAHATDKPPVLTNLADRPAVDLYLGNVWRPIRHVIDGSRNVPSLAEFADVDKALQACGKGIVDMWSSLGVRGHRISDDQLYLSVNEPVR